VSCSQHNRYHWKLNHCEVGNHQRIVRSNDVINLTNIDQEFLSSNNVQFTIGNETFQEVFCHERLGDNDKVS